MVERNKLTMQASCSRDACCFPGGTQPVEATLHSGSECLNKIGLLVCLSQAATPWAFLVPVRWLLARAVGRLGASLQSTSDRSCGYETCARNIPQQAGKRNSIVLGGAREGSARGSDEATKSSCFFPARRNCTVCMSSAAQMIAAGGDQRRLRLRQKANQLKKELM